MQFDPRELAGETDEILNRFIQHITRTEDEIKDEKEGGNRKTEIKVFVSQNNGYKLGDLSDAIEDLAEREDLHQNVQEYISKHNFVEEVVNPNASYVEIETPKAARTDQFVFIDDGDYLRIVTAERRKWTKKTIERLIDYLPSLERVYFSPGDLESVTKSIDGATISGFTAKYHSYDTDKRLSIRFHGGSKEDLEEIENRFGARPTRLEFGQKNSPADTVRSAVAQEGYFSHSSVKPGYEQKGVSTLNYLSEALEKQDRENFRIDHAHRLVRAGSGTVTEGFTTLQLCETFSDDENPETTIEKLEENILEHKRRYVYSVWEPGKFEVFDKELNEAFEVTVEDSEIRLHAKEGTTAASFRDFCSLLYENFNSTYQLRKVSRKLKA